MGLVVSKLLLNNFRNFEEQQLMLSPHTTMLVGHNASGKTNTIEALQLLTTGVSFRKPAPAQLILEGHPAAQISARFEGDKRVIDMACTIAPRRRSFKRNGKALKSAEVAGTLLSILFNPDDLALVKSSASVRREELDAFGAQAAASFARAVRDYEHTLEQRNRVLKEEIVAYDVLDALDIHLAHVGARVLHARLRLVKRLIPHIQAIYAGIAQGEKLDITYVSRLVQGGAELSSPDLFDMSESELQTLMLKNLTELRAQDLRRRLTCIGPHRDDVVFYINNKDARAYGSQGQQRSVVLALKMAEVILAEEIVGERPLLLLDDVMSELDEGRRAQVMNFIGENIQTVITTTNLGYFTPETTKQALVVPYGTA